MGAVLHRKNRLTRGVNSWQDIAMPAEFLYILLAVFGAVFAVAGLLYVAIYKVVGWLESEDEDDDRRTFL